jgi:hypothetical protein
LSFSFCHFFSEKKVTKKAPPEQRSVGRAPENPACRLAGITAHFRGGVLMELLYYCDFSFIPPLLFHFSVVRIIAILFKS